MSTHPVLIADQWRPATASGTFQATNPATGESLPDEYPVSQWGDVDTALAAADEAFGALAAVPRQRLAQFLQDYAGRLDALKEPLAEMAAAETGLAKSPRLADLELPRTTGQLRQAAAAAMEGSWQLPTIDTKTNIRSYLAPLGPVAVFGPNNFPLAFNAISGGDFAAAIAAGNPVIAKCHPAHPSTTRLMAEAAHEAATAAGLPPGTVQLIYHISNDDGLRLARDPRLGALAFTGSRSGGLALKEAADKVGKPIYLELSSINPVVILPGALAERSAAIADEYTQSCLMAAGQFCTNPGLVLLLAGEPTERFVDEVVQRFVQAPVGTLLTGGVLDGLQAAVEKLETAGAELLTGGDRIDGAACRYTNTLLRASAKQFLERPLDFQTEAFGNAALFVVAESIDEARAVLEQLEGNLTGCFYSHTGGADESLYHQLEPSLRHRVGRLLNDKMPTGVAVTPAMQHGGPFPATGHPGFTSVGIPASLRRFTMLACYDNVRPERLPLPLRDENPGNLWRLIDGTWTQANAGG